MPNSLLKIAFVTVFLAFIPVVATANFSDVGTGDPNYDEINYLRESGVIKGYNDGTFRPSAEITRAELVKLVFSNVGYDASKSVARETKFTDVPSTSWFAPYVAKCLELQAISINPSLPLFYPAAPITKIEALKMIMPIEGIPAPFVEDDTPIVFRDVSVNSSYAYIVRAAERAGLFANEFGTRLYPFKNLTRGEAAGLLYRAGLYNESTRSSGAIIPDSSDVNIYFSQSDADLINNPKFPIFLDIWERINDVYVDKDKIDRDDLILSAISGMVDSLGDPYSIFEKPEDSQQIQDALSGNFEGIGVVMDVIDGNITVVSLLSGSPAEKAGIVGGDVINSVNGKLVKNMEVDEAIDLIKGPAGTKVTIVVLRDGKKFTYTITREKLTMDSVSASNSVSSVKIPDDIGYISIYQFIDTTGIEFDDVYSKVMAKNPKGLILDLRNNPGGYLTTAYDVLGYFVEKGEDMLILKSGSEKVSQVSYGSADFLKAKIPLIVLVNDGTASAAEVVAGAIRDYKIGKLLGEKTYGKGTVQEVTVYSDESFFKLSIAHWVTPLGNDINKVGFKPDIIVEPTVNDKSGKTDTQLERAIAELGV
jgi:carboxyl-terminal processing protease